MTSLPPVSQETYDSIVRENLDDFGMPPEEAVEDAVKQLEAQGVSLGLVLRDLPLFPAGQHPLVLAVNAVTSSESASAAQIAELSAQLAAGLPHRVLAAKLGAAPALLRLAGGGTEVRAGALRALRRLLKQQSDALDAGQLLGLLDQVKAVSGEEGSRGDTELAAGDAGSDAEAAELAALLGVLGSACVLNEANRQLLVDAGLVPLLSGLLEARPGREVLVGQVCRLLRLLTLDDDVRAVVGHAHERARQVMSDTPALAQLLRLCRRYDRPESRRTVARVFDTLACLAVRDEFCQRALELGACEFIVGAVRAHSQDPRLAASGMGLLRNLARNDQVKRAAAEHLPDLMEVAAKFAKQAPVVHQFLGLTANLCLRQPATARRFAVELPGAALLAQLAALHRTDAALMRQLCACVRNAAARDEAEEAGGCVRPALLAQGLERVMNQLLPMCEDEARAALLALGCEVKFKPMLWTGRNGELPRD